MVLIYCWLVVLSAFQTIKKSQRKASATTTFRRVTLPTSSSMFSVSSLKDGIQRVIGCTPPPPYEVGLYISFCFNLFCKMCRIVFASTFYVYPYRSNCNHLRFNWQKWKESYYLISMSSEILFLWVCPFKHLKVVTFFRPWVLKQGPWNPWNH